MTAPTRRVLLDENLDWRLRHLFDPSLDVVSAQDAGWAGVANGELLAAAAEAFDVLVTVDSKMPHQQQLPRYNIAVILIRVHRNKLAFIEPLMEQVNHAALTAEPGTLTVVTAAGPT